MANQTARQRARRAAVDAQAKARRERAIKEKRWDALGVDVAVALAERDELVAACEARAAAALVKLTDIEGLSLPEAVERCAVPELTVREATRLRQLANQAGA